MTDPLSDTARNPPAEGPAPEVAPEALVALVGQQRASAILRTDSAETAVAAMDAAVRGGFRLVEFTLTTPGAFELIQEFARRDGIVAGAGTVLTVEDAERAVAAGARFLVSPVVDETVIEAAHRLGVAAMPGAHTPTEMLRAHRAGAQLVKLFPCPAGGPVWLRSVLGPLPFLKVVPTNGVDAGNFRQWLDAGAWGAGFVTSLFDPRDLRNGDFDRIEERARQILAVVSESATESATDS